MDSLNKWKLKHEQEPGEGGEKALLVKALLD